MRLPPRHSRQYPTPRSLGKVSSGFVRDSKKVPNPFPERLPVEKSRTKVSESVPPTPRSESETVMIGIPTHEASDLVSSLCKSLNLFLREDQRSLVEVMVSDDASSYGVDVVEKCLKGFTKTGGVKTTLIRGRQCLGPSKNRNRLIRAFLEERKHKYLLLLEDTVRFSNSDWLDVLFDTTKRTNIKQLSGLPWVFKDKAPRLSPELMMTLTEGTMVDTVSSGASPVLWLSREVVEKVGYLDTEIGDVTRELEIYSQRIQRVQGLEPGVRYCIKASWQHWRLEELTPLKLHPSVLPDRSRVAEALARLYSGRDNQKKMDHGIGEPKKEWDYSKTHTRLSSGINHTKVPRLKMRADFSAKYPEVESRALVGDSITVVIGHRGNARRPILEKVIRSLWAQTLGCKIILVEQDKSPQLHEWAHKFVDDYVFCYSDRPYNRGWAFNVGVLRSSSPFVLLHDGDLVVPEDYLEKSVRRLTGYDALVPWSKIKYLTKSASEEWPGGTKKTSRSWDSRWVHGGSMLLKRKTFLDVGGMDERFEAWGAEDDAFFLKLSRLSKVAPFRPTGACLYHLYHGRAKRDKDNRKGTDNNYKLLRWYQKQGVDKLRKFIAEQGVVGNPDKYLESAPPEIKSLSFKKPHRVLVIYDSVGWAYWHRAKALQKYAPSDFQVDVGKKFVKGYDLILLLVYNEAKNIRHRLGKSGKLVVSFNTGYGHRHHLLPRIAKHADWMIINNVECWEKSGPLPHTSPISNGVDLEVFNTKVPILKRPRKVLWTGSVVHADHKGYGKILRPLKKELARYDIELDLRRVNSHGKKWNHRQMADWYNTGQVYVVASKTEGTPNPALEAAACGCPVVSTRVGNMPELIVDGVNGRLVNRSVEELSQAVIQTLDNVEVMSEEMVNTIKGWDWKIRSQEYFDLFRGLLDENYSGSSRDVSSDMLSGVSDA